jgi:hypothetical protein
LFAQLKTLPWAQIPIGHQTRERGHGRRETRTVKAVTLTTPGGIGFPHAAQAIRITRTRTLTSNGKTSRGFHRTSGETNIARANHRPHDLITAVTSDNPRTQ